MSKLFRFSTKKLIFFVTIGFLIYFIASKWIGPEEIFNILGKTNPFFIVLALIAEFAAYLGTGLLIWSIFRHLNIKKIAYQTFFKLGTITVLAIHSLPISVFGEAAFNYYFLRRRRIPSGSILAMLVTRLIFSYSAFFFLLGFSLAIMPTLPNVSLGGKIASIIVFLILIVGIIFARTLYLDLERFRRVVGKVIYWLDRAKKHLLSRSQLNKKQKESVIKDVHQGFSPLDSPGLFLKQTAIASIYWLMDIFCLYLVLCSFGIIVNPIKLVIAYSVATSLAAISFIPGGLGILEGGLGLMLVNIGVPINITVMAVITYRLLSFWLLIPVGLISMISLSRNEAKKAT